MLKDRLQQAMNAKGVSGRWVQTNAGLANGYVSLILRGKRANLTEETIAKIAEALGVRQSWLAFGEGPMTDSGDLPAPEQKPSKKPEVADDDNDDDNEESESLPFYKNLPGWREAEKEAKKRINLPNWVWARARNSCGVTVFEGGLTSDAVIRMAVVIYENTDQNERVRLLNAELKTQLKRLRSRAGLPND